MRLELIRCLINEDLDRIDLLVSFLMRSGSTSSPGGSTKRSIAGRDIRVLTTDYLQITDAGAARLLPRPTSATRKGERRIARGRVLLGPVTSFHPKAYLFSSSVRGRRCGVRREQQPEPIGARARRSSGTSRPCTLEPASGRVRDGSGRPPVALGGLVGGCRRIRGPGASARCRVEPGTEASRRGARAAPETARRSRSDALGGADARRDSRGHRAGLVVLATGLGKTWLAAFDSTRAGVPSNPVRRAPRGDPRPGARTCSARSSPGAGSGCSRGRERDLDADVVFASVQIAASSPGMGYRPDAFDYVVVDEFHHADAADVPKIIGHFRPRFLLGPHCDPGSIGRGGPLALCADNLVFECDLVEGCAEVCSAHSPTGRSRTSPTTSTSRGEAGASTPSALTRTRSRPSSGRSRCCDEWLALDGAARPTLGFCCSITHAEFMAEYFRNRASRRSPSTPGRRRHRVPSRWSGSAAGQVQVLFTVDLFNEGVDVPNIEVVLLLRPTESPIVFFQQIGRGLRRASIEGAPRRRRPRRKPPELLGQGAPACRARWSIRHDEPRSHRCPSPRGRRPSTGVQPPRRSRGRRPPRSACGPRSQGGSAQAADRGVACRTWEPSSHRPRGSGLHPAVPRSQGTRRVVRRAPAARRAQPTGGRCLRCCEGVPALHRARELHEKLQAAHDAVAPR